MADFRFVHAADLHLDSPLTGLAVRSDRFAKMVDAASRDALEALTNLVLGSGARFLLLAGDTFDGDVRDFGTGLRFLESMGRLTRAGVAVLMVAGNHDAENRFARHLDYGDIVRLFPSDKATSIPLDDVAATVHGRSFGRRDETENIARDYPAPVPGHFNVGLLHTACEGSEDGHARYAPCTVEQLANHGYQYWALGHVHARAVLHENPHVVYPGNLQGRHPRETGAKGATLVEVADDRIVACRHVELDVVRWGVATVALDGRVDRATALAAAKEEVLRVQDDAGGRAIALRLAFTGQTPLHAELVRHRAEWREDVEAMLAGLRGDVWLERLELATSAPRRLEPLDPTVGGILRRAVVGPDAVPSRGLEAVLAEVVPKLPSAARPEQLVERLRRHAQARASQLALALVEEDFHADR